MIGNIDSIGVLKEMWVAKMKHMHCLLAFLVRNWCTCSNKSSEQDTPPPNQVEAPLSLSSYIFICVTRTVLIEQTNFFPF